MIETSGQIPYRLPFVILDEAGLGFAGNGRLLDERERRLVLGAATFHAFAAPGRTFRLTVLRGPAGSLPSLTDEDVRGIEWRADREVVGSMVLRSTVHTTSEPMDSDGLIDLTIDIGGGARIASAYHELSGVLGTARRAARFMAPIQFDALRQFRTDLVERRHGDRDVPRQGAVRLHRGAVALEHGKTPAVLFGVHWLELGGAERWALDSIQLAKDAGLVPIVITDRESSHPWITRPELDGAVVIPLTHPLVLEQESSLLNGILSSYDVRGVHVHHCTWLYERLPWIKSVRPDLPIVDSLHILEWRTGGFVDIAVRMSSMIQIHHVISPQLRDYLVGRQGLPAEQVQLATLANLTTGGVGPASRERDPDRPVTVTFIGRYTQQKRPYLFLKLAARFASKRVRFIMHGEGELSGEVEGLRTRLGLTDVLELRASDQPVRRTLEESDVLVISSDNEGLTLTTFEATAAGVPVISTDVGSQASLVADDLLCPRHPYAFLRKAVGHIQAMIDEPDLRERWLREQAEKARAFAALPDARSWTRDLYKGWIS